MPAEYANSDSLRIYHTSADYAGGTQRDPDACLGGERAVTELRQLGAVFSNPNPPLIIHHVTGANGEGTGTLKGTGASTVTWTAPSGTAGTAVTIADTETKVIEDTTANKAIRIERDGTTELNGGDDMDFELVKPYNSVLGMDDLTSAEQGTGLSTYRALMLRAHGATATNVKVWIKTLGGTQQTTDTTQLGAAGAGTIATTGSFATWKEAGWAHVLTSAPATKEIVYYTSRTATVLTVPAAGRGLLGTSATAGAGTDTVDEVPGIRMSYETHASGAIQTVANEATAPSSPAPTWDTGITESTGLSLGSLADAINHGLWIHREIPVGIVPGNAMLENAITLKWTSGGTDYQQDISGLYRVAENALALYSVWVGVDTDPDVTAAADATSATLPFTVALTPGAGDTVQNYIVREQNAYNLESYNLFQRRVSLDNAGNEITADPTAPTNVAVTGLAGGYVSVTAEYNPDDDADAVQANTWNVFVRGNGSDPDTGADTPTDTTMATDAFFALPRRYLRATYGPYPNGTDFRVLVRAKRSGDSATSSNTTVTTHTVATKVPTTPARDLAFFGSSNSHEQTMTLSRTVVIHVGQNVYYSMTPGITDLYWDTTWIWRMKYDSALDATSNNGIWTTFDWNEETISGAGTGPVEVVAGPPKLLYVCVNGTRKLKIDVTNATIGCATLESVPANIVTFRDPLPCYGGTWYNLFAVWDRAAQDYRTVAHVDDSGVFVTRIDWRQRATTGDFE